MTWKEEDKMKTVSDLDQKMTKIEDRLTEWHGGGISEVGREVG